MGITRRTFLGAAGAAAAVAGLAACSPNPLPSDQAAPAPTDGTTSGSTSQPAPDETTSAVSSAGSSTTGPAASVGSSSVTTVDSTSTTAPWQPGQPARFVPHGPRERAQVALTFHANGDVALANRMLDLLKRRSTPATVFVVGNWLAANPAVGHRILAEGHELANHTWSHQTMGPLSAGVVYDEIKRGADAINQLSGSPGKWFRPSGIVVPTDLILAQAGKAGYAHSIGYDLDSLDFQDPGAAAVISNVERAVQNGSIISLHFGHANTLDALPKILDDLAAKSLEPVTVSRMLA